MTSRLAIYHPPGQIGLGDRPFGKDVANRDLYAALALHGGYDQLDILSHGGVTPEALSAQLFEGRSCATRIGSGHILSLKPALEAGVLLRGKAELSPLAWLRRRTAGDAAFSLAGVVHTIAPPALREYIAAAAIAPTREWDALICTSPSVQTALTTMFEEWTGFLADRFGGTRRPIPRLPLVPLGVDLPAIAAAADDAAAGQAMRAELGLAEGDVMLLWVGRLSFFEKAFPQPMFAAAEEAARATGAKVWFVHAGWFPNAGDRERYEAAAAAHAPSVEIRFLPGDDRARIGALWSGADVFISLVDNIQETFGITPVEAMAAGLPVVVSDWDGYRYTVRDGQEGFLIPTLGGPPDQLGYAIANRHVMGMESYQTYVGLVAQHTAVNIGKAAEALAALIRSPDLRRRMGEAGRERVRTIFDWPVVVAALKAEFAELDNIRAAATPEPATAWRVNPVKGDPFRDFAGFASQVLAPETPLRLRPGVDVETLRRTQSVDLDRFGYSWRGSPEECERALALIGADEAATVASVTAQFPPNRNWSMQLSLMWMMKLGMLDWLEPDGSAP